MTPARKIGDLIGRLLGLFVKAVVAGSGFITGIWLTCVIMGFW